MNEYERERFVDNWLENESLEDLLEVFDVSPHQMFELLLTNGLIDEDLLAAYKQV